MMNKSRRQFIAAAMFGTLAGVAKVAGDAVAGNGLAKEQPVVTLEHRDVERYHVIKLAVESNDGQVLRVVSDEKV